MCHEICRSETAIAPKDSVLSIPEGHTREQAARYGSLHKNNLGGNSPLNHVTSVAALATLR